MAADPTIFIVDDDAGIRQSLKAFLTIKRFLVRTFESAETFLAALPAQASGCLVVDVRLPGMSGLDLQRELKRRQVDLPVVVITGHGDVPMAVTALKAGALDFLEKPFDTDVILAAVQEALRAGPSRGGTTVFDRSEIELRFEQLTSRECEVMDLVVLGHPNKVIAHRLGIAVRTVEIHRARVMEKTGARNLSQLVRMAIQLSRTTP